MVYSKECGYYWTSTINENYKLAATAYYRRIAYYNTKIERNTTTIEDEASSQFYPKYMSVRYVRDAQ